MAGAFVQHWETIQGTTVGSANLTGITPTANNLLVAFVGVRGGGDVFTTDAAWTQREWFSSGNFGGEFATRVASGVSGEDDYDTSWTDTGRRQAMVCEYSGLDTSSPFEASAEDAAEIADATATSVGTGTATPTNASGTAVAVLCVQDRVDFSTSDTTGAGISETLGLSNVQYHAFASNRTLVAMGHANYTSATGKATTWSTTEAGGECYGCIAVFKEPGGGGGGLAMPIAMYYRMQFNR